MEQQVTHYKATVLFEVSFDTHGNNFLVIYGKHVNGYFCSIPNWKVSCEMAEPSDTFYNRSKLAKALIPMASAEAIAKMIKAVSEEQEKKKEALPQIDEREVLNELLENLYYSMDDKLNVYREDKLARAYAIAKQLCEFDLVDKDEVEDFVDKIIGVTK